jgi:putative ABC transport system permease protein
MSSSGSSAGLPGLYTAGLRAGYQQLYVVLQIVFGGIGAIALLVAAIGIANTMAMAILERAQEIGDEGSGCHQQDVLSVFWAKPPGSVSSVDWARCCWVGAPQLINVVALAYVGATIRSNRRAATFRSRFHSLMAASLHPGLRYIDWLVIRALPGLNAATMIPVNAKYE